MGGGGGSFPSAGLGPAGLPAGSGGSAGCGRETGCARTRGGSEPLCPAYPPTNALPWPRGAEEGDWEGGQWVLGMLGALGGWGGGKTGDCGSIPAAGGA